MIRPEVKAVPWLLLFDYQMLTGCRKWAQLKSKSKLKCFLSTLPLLHDLTKSFPGVCPGAGCGGLPCGGHHWENKRCCQPLFFPWISASGRELFCTSAQAGPLGRGPATQRAAGAPPMNQVTGVSCFSSQRSGEWFGGPESLYSN